MNELLIKMAEIEADRGIATLISIIFIGAVFIGLIMMYKNWKDQKAWERKRADRKDKLDEDNLKANRETTKYMAGIVASNNLKMESLEGTIINHQEHSSNILQRFDTKLDNLDDKVKIIGHTQDNLATKEMVEDVSQDIKDMRKELRQKQGLGN